MKKSLIIALASILSTSVVFANVPNNALPGSASKSAHGLPAKKQCDRCLCFREEYKCSCK